jgi:hypothetical protein
MYEKLISVAVSLFKHWIIPHFLESFRVYYSKSLQKRIYF